MSELHLVLKQCMALQPSGPELEEEAGAGLVVKCDAVVVGSGAGAGPCTALLAAAGLRVVVLEKGTFTPNHELTLTVLSLPGTVSWTVTKCTVELFSMPSAL